jgi:AraC-like DNA-binding protein
MAGGDAEIPSGYYRIFLVRRGAARLGDSAQERILLPRSAALLFPDTDCRLSPGSGAEFAHLAFGRSALDPETLGGEAGALLGMLEPDRRAIRVIRPPPAAFEEAWSTLRRLEEDCRDDRPGAETMRRLRLAELLVVLCRFGLSGSEAPARESVFKVEDAVGYIKERYAEELSLPGMASHFGLNPSYFSRAFARYTGVHLFEYINRVRIGKGCVLLKRSSLSIIDIAFAVGYNNLSHFNRYFRRIVGMSPREYRIRSKK